MSPTILLIHDDPEQARIVFEALAHSSDGPFRFEWLRSCAEGVERLSTELPGMADGIAAVVVDLFLPDSWGIETLDRLLAAATHVPILVLSAEQDEALAKEAVRHGAQDFMLTTRVDSYSLPKVLGSMLGRAAVIGERLSKLEGAQVTLNSIGDAVLSVDVECKVTYLNAAAENVIGWKSEEAQGLPVEALFSLVDSVSNQELDNPLVRAVREDRPVGLAPNCVLIRRDRSQIAIEDSVAPIHDQDGKMTGAVMVFRDVTAARVLALKTAYQSRHDSLTDLPTRSVLKDRLAQAITVARRNGNQLAVLFMDLDRFKQVNDSLGHAVGDRLLQSVAQRLISCVRGSDTVSRQGGDEFVLLLPEVPNAQAAAVSAHKILLALRAPHLIDGREVRGRASIGISVYPDDGTTVEALMKNADTAMYRAKTKGRGSPQFFKGDLGEYAVQGPAQVGAGASGRKRFRLG